MVEIGRRNHLCQPDSIGGQIKAISVPVHLAGIHQVDSLVRQASLERSDLSLGKCPVNMLARDAPLVGTCT